MTGFGYSALTPELVAMTQELDSLGGGDARIGKATVCCMAAATTSATSILQNTSDGLSVLDPRGSMGASHSDKVFPVTAHLQGRASGSQMWDTLGQAAVDWLLDGFNATLLAVGQCGTGKSTTLLGAQSDTVQPLLPAMLHCLFGSRTSANCRISLSCWEVVQHHLVDLLTDGAHQQLASQGGSSFAATEACRCVEAVSEAEALSLLHLAQSNSSNWASDEHGHLSPLPNRAHLFVRIAVYDTVKQQISTLHVVDLAGSQRLADSHDGQKHREKLLINQQLLSLSKAVSELSRLSTLKGGGAARHVTSARDSPLMQLVAPLVAGNARTFLLAAVSSHPNSYLETVNTLRIATRAQSIQTACMRTTGVRPDQVQMVPAVQVLAEHRDRRARAARHQSVRHQEALASQAQSQLCSNHRRGDARPCSSNGCMFAESSACCPSSSSQCVSIQAQDQAGDLRAEQAGSEDAQVATSGAQRLQSAATMPWQPQTVRPATTAAVGVASAWAGWPEVQRAASQQPLECSTGQVAEPPMCDPKELAWEGLLHAAMGNAQAPPGPGDLNHEPSFAFDCGVRPSPAPETMPCSGSRVGTAHTSGLPLASGGSAPVSHGDRGLSAPAAVYEHSVSLRPHGVSSSADAVSLGRAQQQDWVRQSVLGPSGVGLTAAPEILAKAEEAAQTVGVDELAAFTPSELADHLLQLKREFRQIYSSILDDGLLQSREGMTAAAGQLPTTNKQPITLVSGPPPAHHPASHSPTETPKLPVPPAPCVIPCCAAEWPELDIPALQQQQADVPIARHPPEAACHQQPVLHVEQANNRATLQATAALQDSHYSAPLPEMSPDPPQPQGSAGALTQPSTWGGDSAQERLQVVPASLDGLQDAPECVSLDSHMPPASCSRAFLDALRPRSPVERCSPEVAAHAQRSLSGSPKRDGGSGQQAVADLRINNEALLCMLERERQHSHQLQQRLQQVEADALERVLEQEVGLEEGRLAALALRTKCRKLESESLFSEVFEKYEEEIRQLQGDVQLLKQSNCDLNQQLASNEPMGPHPRSPLRQLPIALQPSSLKGTVGGIALPTSPTQPRPSGQQNQFSTGHTKTVTQAQSQKGLLAGELEHGCDLDHGEVRLQTLRKQLKRSAAECGALKADVAELRRRDRTADLYKNKANDGVQRVSKLQKELARCKQELQACKQAALQAAENISDLQGNNQFLEAEHVQALSANQDLQASVQTLREQVKLLRSERQRAVVLAHLPPLRPEARPQPGGGPSKCTALEVACRLQLEPAHTPKVAALVERVAEEVHLLCGDRQSLQQRETILMELLTGPSSS